MLSTNGGLCVRYATSTSSPNEPRSVVSLELGDPSIGECGRTHGTMHRMPCNLTKVADRSRSRQCHLQDLKNPPGLELFRCVDGSLRRTLGGLHTWCSDRRPRISQ